MSEWRDFLESVELTDRQKQCLDLINDIENTSASKVGLESKSDNLNTLKLLLIEEFTGVRIV